MLNFILCDDCVGALKRLNSAIETSFIKHNFDAKIALSTTNPLEVLEYIQTNPVDVVFLDIDMRPQMSGLELAEKIRQKSKDIYLIFTTGHFEYGLIAYRYKTFDYLSKPITAERVEDTLLRLFDDISYSPKSFIKIDNKNTIISADTVNYIVKEGMKSIFYTDDHVFEVYNSFSKLEASLPNNFMRCHKSYIVNLDKITGIQTATNQVDFGPESHCYIGPKYKEKFMEVFNHHGPNNKRTNN